MKLGNELWDTRDFQTPGATTALKLGTSAGSGNVLQLEYNYHATQNNGNLLSHGIVQPGKNWKQSYEYDGTNRLKCAAEALNAPPADPCSQGAWRQTFGYDSYSNRWVASAIGLTGVDPHEPTVQSNFEATTNRVYVNNSGYDAAGNQTRYEPWNLFYDAENRIRSVVATPNALDGTGTFVYDAEGRRVKKIWTAGATTHVTYYLYSALGQLAAEYSTRPAVSTGAVYIHTDLLNSVRMVTGEKPANGPAPILECYDYVPFGRMLSSSDNSRNTGCYPASPEAQITTTVAEKFTGKERDAETRLDYFGARYFSAAQGRFTSLDPFNILQDAGDREELNDYLGNPQHWNKYAYSLNNPLKYVDPDGNHPVVIWLMQLAQRGAPYANRAATAVQRYGSQAYIWATRFLNSPTGQEVTATAAEVVTGAQLPFGFSNAAQFQEFGKAVSGGLREVAGEGVQAFLAGSAITGKSFRTGEVFDVGRRSDFDVAVVGAELLAKAKELGIALRGRGTRTGPLKQKELETLGLDELAKRLSRQAGRKVSFMIYETEEALRRRGAPYGDLQ
jgi:RHS repeat-associated protein